MKSLVKSIAWSAVLVLVSSTALAQKGAPDGQWPAYSGDKGSTKYSALKQINKKNVKDLQVAWRWSSPDGDVEPGAPGGNKVTPLFIDGVLYMGSMYGIASAIDAKSGETIWSFDPEVWKGRRPGNLGFNARGLSYWSDGKGDNRIYLSTQRNYMYALNAQTGELIDDFGDGGTIDLIAPYRREVNRDYVWAISPSLVAGDTIVMGRAINDVPTTMSMPPGDVFAFDARSGTLKWTFHNPPLPGEVGYDTWEDGSADYSGNANVWTHMSADEELGLVYLPFGTPTNDWYGGHRKGKNLFAESIVAVKAETGELVWYFQHVHHGLWDYDLPTAPALVDIKVDGRKIKALAQITKQGYIWVLDRTNGEPVWPIEERPVPKSDVPGEESWPTQPHPSKPAPYAGQGSTEDLLIDYTPELKAEAIEILKGFKTGPLYTPGSTEKPTIYNPGWSGSGNWMGVSIDPDTGMVYIPSTNGAAMAVKLVQPDAARSNFNYTVQMVRPPQGPDGLSLWKGPYATVSAIDLNTGEYAWKTPIGDGPINHPRLKHLNLPPQGGRSAGFPLLTKTLLFLATGGGADSPHLRALDKKTGEILAEISFEGSPGGAPMTYMLDGKQYIAIPVSGGRGKPGELVVMSLP